MNDLEDKKQELSGTIDDLKNLVKFWDHFKIPLPDGAMDWINTKLAEPSPTLSRDEKLEVQYFVAYGQCSGADVFADDIFAKPIENSQKIVYERQFEKDLNKIIEVAENEGSE